MAEFEIRNTIDIAAEQFYETCFLDESFNERLYRDELGHRYELLESNREAGYRRARVEPRVELPAMLRKVIGDGFGYVEEGRYDLAKRRYDFTVVPSKLADKLKVRGQLVVEPLGPDRCARICRFEVEAKIFGVGKAIEAFLEKSMRDTYERSATFTNRYLATRKKS